MVYYLAIVLLFMIPYGVSIFALQYPRRNDFFSTLDIFRDIIYIPYFQIYGELFLEEIEGLKFGLDHDIISYV